MTWSLFEARDQLAEQERRRQEIAARTAAAQAPPVTTAAVAAPVASGPPAGGYTSAMALKAGEPDIAKRRGKRKAGRTGPDLLPEDPVSADTEAVAEGTRAVLDETMASTKATVAPEGPGRGMAAGPGEPPGAYDRGYLTEGHAAPSPQHGPPRTDPLPSMTHYVPPGDPAVAAIPEAAIRQYTSGSPGDR